MVTQNLRRLVIVLTVFFSGFVSLNMAYAKNGKDQYLQAVQLFEAEEFEAALPLFEQAYELSNKRPSTILGLAQCERALKMYGRALTHFNEFLATKPDEEQRLRVEETVRLTRVLFEQRKQSKTKVSTDVPKPPPPPPSAAPKEALIVASTPAKTEPDSILGSPWLWVAVGLVVTGGAVGTAFALQPSDEAYNGNTGIVLQP